jgi:hypothetical protein
MMLLLDRTLSTGQCQLVIIVNNPIGNYFSLMLSSFPVWANDHVVWIDKD